MKWITRITRHVEETFPALLIGILTLVVSIDVFSRYLWNRPIKGAGELAMLMFTWQVFVGAAAALRRGLHVNVDIVILRLPARGRAALSLVVNLCILAMTIIVGVMGWNYAFTAKNQWIQTLNLPFTWAILAVPLSCLLMSVHLIRNIYEAFRGVLTSVYRPVQQGFEGTGAILGEDQEKERGAS
jgi:TRAP-type C4-dicarboxylate transport system permease small subunit